MKKKISEQKVVQAEELSKDKKNIDKIMNKSENSEPETEKKETEEKEVNEEKNTELAEIKADINKLAKSISIISSNIAAMQKDVVNDAPNQKQPNAQDNIQKIKMLNAMLAEKRRADAMRKHIFAQAEDLKQSFSDFDLKALYNSSPEFKAELDRTRSVYGAYLKYIASKLGNIPAAKPRFVENGAMPGFTSGSVSASPAALPDKEFDEYIRGILGEL